MITAERTKAESTTVLFAICMLLTTLSTAVPASAATASLDAVADGLHWNPDVAFDRADLRIQGPDGSIFDRTFEQGDELSFSFSDWKDIPVGTYSWSLTMLSGHSPELMDAMKSARDSADHSAVDRMRSSSEFQSFILSGHFAHDGLRLIVPGQGDEATSEHDLPTKDQQITDSLSVTGSACVGLDCQAVESYGFDTIRMKENNIRIKAEDTSNSEFFPTVDWQLTFNDSQNGGNNRFSVESIDNAKVPFTVEYGADTHSLYVDGTGQIGMGTSSPVTEAHIVDGDSPTLRLEQDASGGFTPQKWDLGGNESGFFVRDATNGAKLSLRIRPGAPESSIDIASDGDVGIGKSSPDANLHVYGTNGATDVVIEEASSTVGQRILMHLKNNGFPTLRFEDTAAGEKWNLSLKSDQFEISKAGTSASEFRVDASGNLKVLGTVSANNGADVFPDYVFEEGYDLMPLPELAQFINENGHLPRIPSAEEVERAGSINMTKMQYSLLEKVEELTLYTLSLYELAEKQGALIEQLQERLEGP